MRRILIVVAIAATLTVPAALALPTAGALGALSVRAKLVLRHTSVGTILVNGRGFTLYAFTRDRRNKDACQNIQSCLTAWPALTTSGRVLAGPGVRRGLIGTIKLKSGAKQVTYRGHPLYTYLGDSAPAQTSYVNFFQFNGRWPAVNAAGREVK